MLATPTTKPEPELATGTVGEAMSAGVLTCPPETPLRSVARMMATYRVHCIVVFGHDSPSVPWGVISDMDLVAGLRRRLTAGSVAGSPVVAIGPDRPLEEAAKLMVEHGTAHLLVVDQETALPMGVISTLDIARAYAAEPAPTEYVSG